MLAEAPAAEAPAAAEEMQQLIGDRARRRASRDGLEPPEPDGAEPHSKALGAFFALCTALSLGLAAVCVKLADCSVLWLMAARCVGDTTLSTASTCSNCSSRARAVWKSRWPWDSRPITWSKTCSSALSSGDSPSKM